MKKLGKPILLYLLLMLLFLLAGCGEEASSGGGEEGKIAQGVTDKEILVGISAPQTGPLAAYDAFRKGADTYFKYVNENGGVLDRKIKLIAYDDQYQPAKATQTAKRLVEDDKVFLVFGNQGTAANQAAKEIYIDSGMPVVMPGTGVSEFVNPPVKNWFGSSMVNYEMEAMILLDYAVKELGAKKIAIAYQNDDFGKVPMNALKEALSNYPGVEVVEEVTYLPSDTEFSSQAQKLDKADPDTIFNFGVMNPVVNLKKALYKIGKDDMNYFVTSVGGGDVRAFELAGGNVWDGTYFGGVLTSLDDEDDEQVKLFKEQFAKEYPKDVIAGFSQSGWSVASLVVEALKRTEGDLTWDNFYKAMYTFNDYQDLMYSSITFNENNHYGITKMYVSQANAGKLEHISELISFDPETGEITQ